MTKNFINPFHFVPPMHDPVGATPIADVKQTLTGKPGFGKDATPSVPELLHDRYLASSTGPKESRYYSGRIVCKITTMTPCVFGNEHTKVKDVRSENSEGRTELVDVTRVDNFQLDGFAAIAGTSLKGMLSSIAEMASGSAMRVLNNRALSIRSSMSQSRSAMGIIVGKKGDRKIIPLCLPTFSRDNEREPYRPTNSKMDSENLIWHKILEARHAIEPSATLTAQYVEKSTPDELCFHADRKVVAIDGSVPSISWDKQRKQPARDQDTLVTKGNVIRPGHRKPVFEVVPVDPKKDQVMGIVRSLGKPTVVPKNLWFAMFLPICSRWRSNDGKLLIPIEDQVALALDAEDACCDFDSIVTHEFSNAPDDAPCTVLKEQVRFEKVPMKNGPPSKVLKEGDLVFFRPQSATKVESVAISSIWREGVRWMWNPKSGEPDLLDSIDRHPMHPNRTIVSLAEKLFGWVDDVSQKKDPTNGESIVSAYKGRVRVSDALSPSPLVEVELQNDNRNHPQLELRGHFPLKILASPKPPCPELYMRDIRKKKDPNLDIRKEFPSRSNKHIQCQGWKFYILDKAKMNSNSVTSWKTLKQKSDLKQKSWVRPIKCNTEFWFHIDFENLTREELQLLCYAIQPGPEFIHRCGFGKPLQLGAIKLEAPAIFLIDRKHRYVAETKLLSRPSRFRSSSGLQSKNERLEQRRYDVKETKLSQSDSVESLSEEYALKIGDHHKLMMLSGTPVTVPNDSLGVTYPRLSGDGETKIFEWFVENRDKRGGLYQPPLPELTPHDKTLPSLKINALH